MVNKGECSFMLWRLTVLIKQGWFQKVFERKMYSPVQLSNVLLNLTPDFLNCKMIILSLWFYSKCIHVSYPLILPLWLWHPSLFLQSFNALYVYFAFSLWLLCLLKFWRTNSPIPCIWWLSCVVDSFLGLSWIPPSASCSFADSDLYPSAVINLNCEYISFSEFCDSF